MKEPKLTELECVIELDNMNKYAKEEHDGGMKYD